MIFLMYATRIQLDNQSFSGTGETVNYIDYERDLISMPNVSALVYTEIINNAHH